MRRLLLLVCALVWVDTMLYAALTPLLPRITEHLHLHVVPRWNGDTNFMPVTAQTTVVPQALSELAGQLRAALHA